MICHWMLEEDLTLDERRQGAAPAPLPEAAPDA
jgi:hypothetical protein